MRCERRTRFHVVNIFFAKGPLFFVASLPTSSFAQSVNDASTSPGSNPSTVVTSSMSATASIRSTTASIVSSTLSSTASTAIPSSTSNANQNIGPGGMSNADPPTTRTHNGVINYFFLFLALFVVAVAIFLWWVHKRRIRRKEAMRLSGQNALARDMDGWINTRRWYHGTGRHNQTAAFVRRENGLDENGEAPPPYRPKSEGTAAVAPESGDGPAIPLRVLARDDLEQGSPPEYRESAGRRETARTGPETADARDAD